MKQALLKFDPSTGNALVEHASPDAWRNYHGPVAWLFNPYTGAARDSRDIGTDVHGHLIYDEDPVLRSVPKTLPEELEHEIKLQALDDNFLSLSVHLEAALKCLQEVDIRDPHVKTDHTSAVVKLQNLQVLTRQLYVRQRAQLAIAKAKQ